jgi:hypothetical protein
MPDATVPKIAKHVAAHKNAPPVTTFRHGRINDGNSKACLHVVRARARRAVGEGRRGVREEDVAAWWRLLAHAVPLKV